MSNVLQPVLDKISDENNVPEANEAAKAIRGFQTPYQLFFPKLKRKKPEEAHNSARGKRYQAPEASQQQTSLETQRYNPEGISRGIQDNTI